MKITSATTQLCISLSERPGSFGNRFHNYLYGELKLDFIYKSGTTADLRGAIQGLKALKIRGCGLSMPYKEQAIEHVLALGGRIEPAAQKIGAINTIVNEDVAGAGSLVGYNTDAIAVRELLQARRVGAASRVALAGSGGMARACAYALAEVGCKNVAILSRNRVTGTQLAQVYGFRWQDSAEAQAGQYDVLVNATPVGMKPDPSDKLSFAEPLIRSAKVVVESVAYPPQTGLLRVAREAGLVTVDGFEITLTQGVEQFQLYTGVKLRVDQIGRAAAFARHTG